VTSTATGTTGARAARAAVFALVAVVVASLGHAAGEGAVPQGATLALAVVISLGIGALLARHRWSAGRLVAALAVVQVVVHGSAWIASGPSASIDPRLAGLAPEHLGHAHAPLTLRMLLAHAVAVGAAAVLLAAVARGLALVAAAARRALAVVRLTVPALPPLPLPAAAATVAVPAPHVVVSRSNAPPAG
jgi:hypothetical protein